MERLRKLVGEERSVEEVSRELIEYCGLEWDPKILDFHQTRRVVTTSSSWQVRHPIYKRSVERWKNYEDYLQPLKKALDG